MSPISGSNAAIIPTVPQGQRLAGLSLFGADQNLSLANGMTAGYGVGDGNTSNPLPNPNQFGTWPLQPNRIGFMRNLATDYGDNTVYTLYFIYNPNDISTSWQMQPGSYSPLYLYGGQQSQDAVTAAQSPGVSTAVPAYAGAQSVTWTLFFDRTYDMMYGNSAGARPQDDRGVLKDVAALYNLMGTFLTDAAVPVSGPCKVVFGQNGSGQLWGFTGYISQMNVDYGIFRHDMIPSKAEVNLTLTCTYVADGVPGSGGAAGAAGPPGGGPVDPQNPSGSAQTTSSAYGPSKAQGPPPATKSKSKSKTNPLNIPGFSLPGLG